MILRQGCARSFVFCPPSFFYIDPSTPGRCAHPSMPFCISFCLSFCLRLTSHLEITVLLAQIPNFWSGHTQEAKMRIWLKQKGDVADAGHQSFFHSHRGMSRAKNLQKRNLYKDTLGILGVCMGTSWESENSGCENWEKVPRK